MSKKELIHYFPDEMYNTEILCNEDSYSWTCEEQEVTCPKCLADLWVTSNPDDSIWKRLEESSKRHNKYIPYGSETSGPDNWSHLDSWEFLSLPENEDLFWKFIQEHGRFTAV
jgi:hypothetical protein